jgi:hypothetical protein
VKMDQVCQDKIGRLGGVAGSVVLYVSVSSYTDLYSFYIIAALVLHNDAEVIRSIGGGVSRNDSTPPSKLV